MAALARSLTLVGNPVDWSLFFARQPEPDLEFTEEELDQTTSTRPITPIKMPKRSGGGRPLLWIILLALVGGIGYVIMEPEQLTEWLAPILGEPTPQEPAPPVAMKPKPAVPAPPAPAAEPSPAPMGQGEPVTPAPTPPPAAPASQAQAPAPASPAPAPVASAPSAPPARVASSPLFAEGQKVTVMGNPAVPNEMVALTMDPAGTKPGPAVRPGATLSILDGDLQAGGWVYSVRTDDGVKGWISEKRLRLKF